MSDASDHLKTALSEEYANSANFSDGEIFLKLREYDTRTEKQAKTMFAEMRMWGRLSRDKRKDLKQILKRKSVLAALDALRILPGLFTGFRIEHRFLAMKCDEVGVSYCLLRHLLRSTIGSIQLPTPHSSGLGNDLQRKEPSHAGCRFPNGETITTPRARILNSRCIRDI